MSVDSQLLEVLNRLGKPVVFVNNTKFFRRYINNGTFIAYPTFDADIARGSWIPKSPLGTDEQAIFDNAEYLISLLNEKGLYRIFRIFHITEMHRIARGNPPNLPDYPTFPKNVRDCDRMALALQYDRFDEIPETERRAFDELYQSAKAGREDDEDKKVRTFWENLPRRVYYSVDRILPQELGAFERKTLTGEPFNWGQLTAWGWQPNE